MTTRAVRLQHRVHSARVFCSVLCRDRPRSACSRSVILTGLLKLILNHVHHLHHRDPTHRIPYSTKRPAGEAVQHECCALEQWNIDLDPPGPKSRSFRSSPGRPLREHPPRRRPPRGQRGFHAPLGVSGSHTSVRGEGSEQISRLITGVEYHMAAPGPGGGRR